MYVLRIEGLHIYIAKGVDCHVGAERKKQAAVLKTEGENSYIKVQDKVVPTSQI